MTSDEIKEAVTMSEVMGRYGIKIRNNMCACPFHGKDRHPSMKVFKDGCHCFTCGRNLDVFEFVMEMDGISFKDAFLSLGGTYEEMSERAKNLANERYEQARKDRAYESRKAVKERERINILIAEKRALLDELEPLSDQWCDLKNEIEMLLINGGHYE